MVRVAACLIGIVFFPSSAVADEEKVPLKLETPKEVLIGTPPDVLARLYPGLVMPSKERDLMVPKGTVNLALKKKVTSSCTKPLLGKLAFVNDGDKRGSEDGYVELSPALQWVQIDLEKPSNIHAILLWHYFREARSYNDIIIQVADDNRFTKNVRTLYNNDTDASAKKGVGKARPYIETNLGQLIDTKGVTARYVRLYSRGNTGNIYNHYVEVEVFGKPALKEKNPATR